MLEFLIKNRVKAETVEKIKIVVLTNNTEDLYLFSEKQKNNLAVIKYIYSSKAYKLPKVIVWNVDGDLNRTRRRTPNMEYLEGFDHVMFDQFKSSGKINPLKTSLYNVKQYFSKVNVSMIE